MNRVALGYIALGVLALALFAVPLWYGWSVNVGTFRAYVEGSDTQPLLDAFERDGADGLITVMDARVPGLGEDRIMIFADAAKRRLAGNLGTWPAGIPEEPGTYGLVIDTGAGRTMRIVGTHARLPGGYHLLTGRESVRFQSLVDLYWFGVAAAMALVLVLGAAVGWKMRRAQEELQRQKAHLDELFDLAPDALVLSDISHPRILRINKEFTRMFGYTPEEAVGQRLRHLVVPDGVPPANLTSNPDILAGRKVEMELVRRRKDGTRFHALVTGKRIALKDDSDAMFFIYRDITERKEAEDKLRRSEAFLAEGQRISRTGSWGWVLATGKVTWSDEQYRMLGHDGQGAPEPSVDLFLAAVHPDDRARVRQILEKARAAKRGYSMDYRVLLPDGAVRHLRSVGRPVVAETGAVEEYIGVTMDTASEQEVRRLEGQLRQSQRLEAMGTLAGGIAHDFNNILGAILGYGEFALRDAPRDSRLHKDLESILAAGERGRALVDRVLTFSRSGVGPQVAVHVEGVVRESLDLIGAKLPKGIRIDVRLDAGHAAMLGEPTQVHQILMNLATNAIHAMPAGGILRVSLEALRIEAARAATIGSLSAGDYVVLQVADTGTGIPPEILERIFDPFFTTKEVNVGTGLGLSLVHGIVMDVGGAIDVASTVGSGSVFTVYMPRAGDASDEPREEDEAMPRGAGERVLVVDDEEPLVRLVTQTLEDLGYAPEGFTSSAAALQAFRDAPDAFHAVVTDERMPGIAGSALIHDVRKLSRSIPILLVSGYVGGMVANRAFNEGADEVLKKPLSARELATTLARVLHR